MLWWLRGSEAHGATAAGPTGDMRRWVEGSSGTGAGAAASGREQSVVRITLVSSRAGSVAVAKSVNGLHGSD